MTKHYFTSDLHFGHANIIKYSGRTEFMNDAERATYALHANEPDTDKRPDFRISRETTERMNHGIIANINAIVGEDDVLWHLGDWCFGPAEDSRYLADAWKYRNQIKCRNVNHIWGNHDRRVVIKDCFGISDKLLFIAISRKDGTYWTEDDEGFSAALRGGNAVGIVLCHYALLTWDQSHRGSINLYGHSHSAIEKAADEDLPGRRNIDVGIDNAIKKIGKYEPFSLNWIETHMASRPGWRHSEPFKFTKKRS
jgi:calcineurin-like phosphoesterase family protein